MYNRELFKQLKEKITPEKVLVLYGARRVGKTFLLNKFIKEIGVSDVKFVTGEDRFIKEDLSSESIDILRRFIGDKKVLIIDEAQAIPNIGLNLKLIVDNIPNVSVIASGSTSFDLAEKLGEPLLGRKNLLTLFPLSAKEFIVTESLESYKSKLEEILIFGGYPEVQNIQEKNEKANYLLEIANTLILKDIINTDEIRDSGKIIDILTMLAFQIGKEVSLSEIGTSVGLHKDTVAKYLRLLEKTFIIKKVRGFSRNLRKEITKTSRYYFYDNGVRNAFINNFNQIKLRNDIGELWENYIVIERVKRNKYSRNLVNYYFWRTYEQKEIDWVEEKDGSLIAFEIKYNGEKFKIPTDWKNAYPKAKVNLINKLNFLEYIL